MAPAKKQSKGAITARIQANAAWGSLRSVDAPPKPISEGVEPETLGMEIFTPIAVQNERGAPNLSPASVCLLFHPAKNKRLKYVF
jgi:hypothetical protein